MVIGESKSHDDYVSIIEDKPSKDFTLDKRLDEISPPSAASVQALWMNILS